MTLGIDTIQTKNNYFDYANLNPDLVDINDIAHALSRINRFNGHTDIPFTVAQHCCFIHDMMQMDLNFSGIEIYGLLHDAEEAYVQDMVRPIKNYLLKHLGINFNKIFSDPVSELIHTKYDLPHWRDEEVHKIVKHYDNLSLVSEKKYLFKNQMDWGWTLEPVDYDLFELYLDTSTDWKQGYVDRFNEFMDLRAA